MLPRDEWLALIHTLATAIDRAGEGKLAEGYAALQAGLTRALEQQGRGKPGSAEAVAAGSLTLRGAVPVGSGGRIAVRGAAGLALLQPAPARARRRCRRRARSPGWRLNT